MAYTVTATLEDAQLEAISADFHVRTSLCGKTIAGSLTRPAKAFKQDTDAYSVATLRQILAALKQECQAKLTQSGRKEELKQKICTQIDTIILSRNALHCIRTQEIVRQIRRNGECVSHLSS